MRIDRIILASDDNEMYKHFWPLIAHAWYKLIGVKPTLVMVGDSYVDESLGDVIRLRPIPGIPTSFSSQVVRVFLPALFPEDICLISDIDMLPLNAHYFVQTAAPVADDHFIIYSSDAYSPDEHKYPMCYLAGKGSIFQEIIGLPGPINLDDIQHGISIWHSIGLGWNTDEVMFGRLLHAWQGYPEKCVRRNRGWNPLAYRRIDRAAWSIDVNRLSQDFYIDAHLPRPFLEHLNDIEPLIHHLKMNLEELQAMPTTVTPPLVSAIVSAYNAERFIRGCLEDLEAQTIAERLEIVVVDSGSSQNEGTIVREFQQRYNNIVYIRTARRESIYAAWNRGIQAARGTYITNANTDDRHRCDAFERMVAILETRPDVALVYADAYMTRTENETFEAHTPVGELNWPDFDPLELLHRCYIGPQPMWRKRMHTTHGYFDESFEVAGDWEFWLRMAGNETFLHLREFLGLYLSSPTGAENRNSKLLGQENVRVYQRYGHRADRLKNAGAVSGAATTKPRNIKAYKLYDRAAVVQPAPVEREGDAAPDATSADRAIRAASGSGWVLLCPHAFEATWNGGPNPEDIAIRLDATEDDAPAFVQSNLGSGLLTFYAGYQLHTSGPDRLWVRGPSNWPKDGLYALEQIVDTSLLPATITINWQSTRPNQTVRFEASEPFCALVPYPTHYAEQFECEVVELDDDGAVLEQALQELLQAPDLQAVFQRLQQAAAPAELQLATSAAQETASRWAAQLSDPPPVSCVCLTYGRPDLLEEAISSFLQQDYPGPKELIVLNDYDQQTLEFEHPEVRVINVPKRFRTVGEKRNMAVALASHDLLFVWDDDDICLPHRLSFSVAHFDHRRGFFKANSAWLLDNRHLSGPYRNAFHGISCWSRKLFDAVRGYGAAGSGEDMVFEQLLEQQFPGSTNAYDIWPEEIYYIYRWIGTGSYHLSQFGDYRPGANIGHHEVEQFVQQRANRGEIRRGRIPLQPHWNTDYRQLVSSHIAALAEQQAQVQAREEMALATE